jgi:hypothetical protein
MVNFLDFFHWRGVIVGPDFLFQVLLPDCNI